MLRQTGLEIFFSEGGTAGGYEMGGKLNSVLFSFRSSQERDRVHDLLMRQPELAGLKQTRVAEVGWFVIYVSPCQERGPFSLILLLVLLLLLHHTGDPTMASS